MAKRKEDGATKPEMHTLGEWFLKEAKEEGKPLRIPSLNIQLNPDDTVTPLDPESGKPLLDPETGELIKQ